MGSTRYLDISDSLLLCFLLSLVELEAPDPGDTFFADPEAVEVTIVVAFLSALPLVPSLTALPVEIALVSWFFDLEEDPELVVGVSALSTGVSGDTEENKSDTECISQVGVLQGDIAQASVCKNNQCQQTKAILSYGAGGTTAPPPPPPVSQAILTIDAHCLLIFECSAVSWHNI